MIRRWLRAFGRWLDRHWVEFFAGAAVLLLLLIVFWRLIVYTVPPGHVGVMWYRFFGGTVTTPGSQLREGIHFILPWDKIYMYDARLQRIQETVRGLSTDGLEIEVDATARFVIEGRYAGYLHKAIGPNYTETLMQPQLRTLILTYLSENEAADLYSDRRERVQTVVATRFRSALANISTNVPFEESYINLQDVLIEEIRLPEFVRAAIQQKERVRHMSEAYEFRLRLEEKERQRKRIEAEGIRSFQEIVAPGITDSYLRWRGIEATLQLSQSHNAKVVIIGGADGLPIILNTETNQSMGTLPAPAPKPDGDAAAPHGAAPGPAGTPNLGPRSDALQQGQSLAGPSPLTASGAALQQEMMSPPGQGTGIPGVGAFKPGDFKPGATPPTTEDVQGALMNWMNRVTGEQKPQQ